MFIHLAIHHPKPEHVDDMLASMHRVNQAAAGAPGLIEIGAWRDQGSDRLVGLARWESEEAFQAAAPRIFDPSRTTRLTSGASSRSRASDLPSRRPVTAPAAGIPGQLVIEDVKRHLGGELADEDRADQALDEEVKSLGFLTRPPVP